MGSKNKKDDTFDPSLLTKDQGGLELILSDLLEEPEENEPDISWDDWLGEQPKETEINRNTKSDPDVTSDSYEYTKNQNIADAQSSYEDFVQKQREIPTPEHQNTLEWQESQEMQPQNERKSVHRNTDTYDHAQNKNAVDVQSYKSEVNETRDKMLSKDQNALKQEKRNEVQFNPLNADSYDYTKNQNVADAQSSYENAINEKRGILTPESRKKQQNYVSCINYSRNVSDGVDQKGNIEKREIDLAELYEKSSRGGAADSLFTKEFGLSQNDLNDLMSTRGLVTSSNVLYTVSNYGHSTVQTVAGYATGMTFAGNDTGQGLRMTKELLSPMAFIVSDSLKSSMANTMQKNLAHRLNQQAENSKVFGENVAFIGNETLGINAYELKILEKELTEKLKNCGITDLNGNGIIMQRKIRMYLLRNKDGLTMQEKGALDMLMSIAKVKTMNDSLDKGRVRFRRDVLKRSFRSVQQCDVGGGLVLSYNIINRTQKSIKYGSRAIRFSARSVALVGKQAALASAKAAVALAKTRIGKQISDSKAGSLVKKTTRTSRQIKGRSKQTAKEIKKTLETKTRGIRAFHRDPFSLKAKRANLLKNLKKTKVGRVVNGIVTPLSVAKQAVGYAVSTLMSILSAMISAIMGALGMVFLLFLVIVIIIIILTSIFSFFDFSSHDEEIQKAAFEQIKQCYEDQNNQIQSFFSRYRNVTINYQTKKDTDLYMNNSMMSEISSNTNAAEIVSMAVVYFDFDLEKAGEKEVKNYIRKLYNGSHQYYVSETPVYKENEDGEKYLAATDANITLTTHYFNSIFDCALAESSYGGTASFGSDMTGGDVAEKMFNYFKSAGWSDEAACAAIGNAAQESGGTLISGINPSIVGGGGRGVFGFTYSPDSHSADTGMGLVRYANSIGKDWTDLETQLQYFILCMNGTWGSMWNINSFTAREFKNAGYHVPKVNFQQFTQIDNLEDATMAFLCSYENCGIKNARWETRMRESRKAYALYGNSSGTEE
ncbi:MAG: hypothetical protein KHZ91_01515 [Firmicutes bacterium]|nr:hypothetical protein [Bacillota bacterium]